jgi:hypothetical protein
MAKFRLARPKEPQMAKRKPEPLRRLRIPLDFDETVSALLGTPPPPKDTPGGRSGAAEKAKKAKKRRAARKRR